MTAIGVYKLSKRFRTQDRSSRWLRKNIINSILGGSDGSMWRTVLHDINIDIEVGETVAILGTNGSGKSTLLKLMAGILQPTSGRVVRRGSICPLMDIGTGFQEDLTGVENAFIGGALLGLSEAAIIHALPEVEYFAELEGFMDTPVRYYSSGMKARLSFAVAMNANPSIFLIDEVLAVGDEGFRSKCYTHLDKMVSRGRTIVIASHDTYTIGRLCQRAIWIDSGTIRMDGPTQEVLDSYMNYFYQEPTPEARMTALNNEWTGGGNQNDQA